MTGSMKNCTFIGINAGADITDGDGIVIIGDNIRTIPDGERVIIGDTVFGKPCNLKEIYLEYLERGVK